MNNKEKKRLLNRLMMELYELAQRDYMNNHLYFFSRRQKAQTCRILIDDLQQANDIDEATYETIKTKLMHIMFENRSRQILPNTS
jgi:hypothetical protein